MEIREEVRPEEKELGGGWPGLFRRPLRTVSGKATLDPLGPEAGGRIWTDEGRLDIGVEKGSLLAVVGRVAGVSAVTGRARLSTAFGTGVGVGTLSCDMGSGWPAM